MDDFETRIQWPDFCKGIAIILVIVGHAIGYVITASTNGSLSLLILEAIDKWIYSFHMPMFFFISGFLQRRAEKEPYTIQRIAKRLVGILFPYLFFSALFWLSKMLFAGSVNNPVALKDLLYIFVYPLSDLWFLYALAVFFLIRVLCTIIKADDRIVLIVFTGISIAAMTYPWNGPVTATVLPRILKNATFFSAGISFFKWSEQRKTPPKMLSGVLGVLLIALGIAGLYLREYETGMIAGLTEVAVAYCSIGGFFLIGNVVAAKQIRFFGSKSMYTYLTHDYAVCLAVILLKRLSDSAVLLTTAATLTGIAFSVFIIWLAGHFRFIDFFFCPQKFIRF